MLIFGEGARAMKDPFEVLRVKEQDILRVKQEFRKIVNMP
jgi:hypothetical protein